MNPNFKEYPIFEPNQVLSADHLNDLHGYLEEQSRLTRNKTIGVGIVCGLEPTYNTRTNTLEISPGTAITSSGYLIQSEKLEFKSFRKFENKAEPPYSFFSRSDNNFLQVLPFDFASKFNRKFIQKVKSEKKISVLQINKLRYPNFLPDRLPNIPFPIPTLGSMFELVEDKTEFDIVEQRQIQNLNDRFVINNCVVMFYLETRDVQLKNCDVNDCNDKGMTREFTLKAILMPTVVAKKIHHRELFYRKIKGDATQLPKLQIAKFNAAAQEITSYFGLNQRYGQLIRDVIPSLSTAILNSYKLLFPILENVYPENTQRQVFANINNQLTQLVNTALNVRNHWGIQYLYTFVKDLIEAYNELRETAIKWISECDTNEKMFPKHILLGKVKLPSGRLFGNEFINNPFSTSGIEGGFDPENLLDKYRQHFTPVTQIQAHPFLKSQVISLHYKLYLILSRFQGVGLQSLRSDIRVTPSKSSNYPLSERAIPFYYNLSSSNQHLIKNWSFQKTINGELKDVYAYDLLEKSIRSLSMTLDDNNFYKVEGHIGKSYQTVIEELDTWRKDYGLSMDVVAINLGIEGNAIAHKDFSLYFQDLESDFDTYKEELYCLLDKQAAYFENLELDLSSFSIDDDIANSFKNYVKLLPFKFGPIVTPAFASLIDSQPITYIAQPTERDFEKKKKGRLEINEELLDVGNKKQLKFNNSYTIAAKSARDNNDKALGSIYHNHKLELSIGATSKKNLLEYYYSESFVGKNPAVFEWATTWGERTLSIIDHIDKVKEAISSENISDFQFEDFQLKYNDLLKEIMEYRDHIFDLGDSASVEELKIINYLDYLLNDCTTEKFQSIVNEWLRRKEKLEQEFIFSNFIAKHPEMEHGGGVPKGGTLVLVYYDEKALQPTIPDLPLIPRPFPVLPFQPFEPLKIDVKSLKEDPGFIADKENNEKIKELLKEETLRVKAIENTPKKLTKEPDSRIASYRGINKMKLAKDKLDIKGLNLSLPRVDFQSNILVNPILPDQFYSIEKGIVVADFYLPYRCCSDTPSITYAFQAPEIEITLDQKVYYIDDDSGNHTITVNPKGGVITPKIPGLSINKDRNYNFKPSLLKVGDNKFSYEVKGIRKDAVIKVAQVFSDFEIEEVKIDDKNKDKTNQILSITVAPSKPDLDNGYQWSVERLISQGRGTQIYESNDSKFTFNTSFDKRTNAIKVSLTSTVGGSTGASTTNRIYDYDKLIEIKTRLEKHTPQVEAASSINSFDQNLSRGKFDKIPADDLKDYQKFNKELSDLLKEDKVSDLIKGKNSTQVVDKIKENLTKAKDKLNDDAIKNDPVKLDQYISIYDEVAKVGNAVLAVINEEDLDDNKKKEINTLNNKVAEDVLTFEKEIGIVSSLNNKLKISRRGLGRVAGSRVKVTGAPDIILGNPRRNPINRDRNIPDIK
ncbi:MAG: hypothetical protein DWQ02_25570 [Bacteroidetes bacterium]|nr:MAG: hypothetical protein DWQ02_25570 [Bacteroidota bacterium]